MKLGIVGSRTFNNYELLEIWVDSISTIQLDREDVEEIISGGANGADKLAEKYANEHNAEMKIFRPDWNKNGKSAGFIRNQQIVDESDMIIAFWDGKSKGTKDTIDKARKAKKPTFIVYF